MDQDNAGTPNPIMPEGTSTANENTTKMTETITETTIETVAPPPQTSIPPQAMPGQTKKNKGLIAVVIILAVLATAGVAFGVYGMFFQPKPTCETNCTEPMSDSDSATQSQTEPEEKEAYQLSDYVSFSEVSIPVTFPDEAQKGHTEDIIRKIELKNLPANITAKFDETQEKLIANTNGTVVFRSNKADATINGDILSIFTIFDYQGAYEKMGDAETMNYNLKNDVELANTELLADYNLTSKSMYEAILNQLAQNVTTSSFLLATDGDVTAPTISITDFTNNITEYAATLSDSPNLVKLYIDKDDNIHALYQQYQILEALGMSAHMGIGLLRGVQDIKL